MSASPAPRPPTGAVHAAAARVRRLHARTPLRVRLVAAVLLLVALALAGSGAAARATMGDYLVGRVDAQLTDVARGMAQHPRDRDQDGDGTAHPDGHLPSAYVITRLGTAGQSDGIEENLPYREPLPQLPRITAAQSAADGTQAFTVSARRGDDRWRVLAMPTTLPDGTAGTVLVAQNLAEVQNTLNRLTLLLVIIGAAGLVVVGAVGYVVVRASLRPLREVERTAADIAAGDLSHRVPDADPRTEVGHLSGALNTMLAKIETAFAERAASERAARSSEERMRRFVADASHELRTPLTTIRGFAELYRHGAVTDQAEVARVMRRIEDEGKRMGVLVEDLLLLARLDQERPLARAPVDLLALAGDAVHDTRAVAPDRTVRLEVGRTDPPPVVLGDEARLRQVLGNLLANAVRHTPAGTPVTVTVATGPGSRTGAPAVTLTVADEGPGLTPEAAARVFERFYRADPSRNRRDGGTGLGLAIVAALVAGHGGSVDVSSTPGAGACFRVELPLADVAAHPAPRG
jgi:two-component system OmpR family sensor kinase